MDRKPARTSPLVLILLSTLLTVSARAQITAVFADDKDVQSWHDLQINLPVSKTVEFMTRFTTRIGNNVTKPVDDRIVTGFIWHPTRHLSVSPQYWYINARNPFGRYRVENALILSATYRQPLGKFAVSHRATYEKRYRSGRVSWRYGSQVSIDHPLPKKLLDRSRWFLWDEPFYDSTTSRWSRNRAAIGVSRTINEKLTLDIYLMQQNEGPAHPGDLTVIGTTWRLRP